MTATETATGTAQPAPERSSFPRVQMYIAGEWTDGTSGRTVPLTDPATDDELGQVPLASIADLDAALAAAQRGFRRWSRTPIVERNRLLHRAADLMTERSAEIGRIMTLEEGKALPEARGEVLRVAESLRWHADDARRAYGRVIPSFDERLITVRLEPVGPVAAFTPWNFPAGSPMRKISAALSAGCSIVIKASEETPGTACAVVRCFEDAGLPADVLNLVFGDPPEVSSHLIPSPVVRLVAFTGSVPVGKQLASLAVAHMKPTLMELGGHAPVIVCEDADPRVAARRAAAAKYVNAGQVCTSPSRFIVHERVYDEFLDEFVAASEAVVVGNGLHDGVKMGPLANPRRVAAMERLVTDAVERGAKVQCGGTRIEGPGCFFAPTVLTEVSPNALVMNEEPFGPVSPVVHFADLDDAIALANSLPYGLAAYGFTRSSATAERLVQGFEAGILSINHCGGSIHEAPSGGFKDSGYGREGGPEGLDGYLVSKRVVHLLDD